MKGGVAAMVAGIVGAVWQHFVAVMAGGVAAMGAGVAAGRVAAVGADIAAAGIVAAESGIVSSESASSCSASGKVPKWDMASQRSSGFSRRHRLRIFASPRGAATQAGHPPTCNA